MGIEKILNRISETEFCGDAAELYQELARIIMEETTAERKAAECYTGRKARYLSCEFLVGRLIQNNLLNLGILEKTRSLLAAKGIDFDTLEEIEDCALGNGGLGRLAACYLDSAATKGIPLYGYGIRYKYGLFKQAIQNGFQIELPDDWQRFGDPFSVRREDCKRRIVFGDGEAVAVPYDMPVIGYGGGMTILRLWQAEGSPEAEKISEYLYPDDNTDAGKKLRLRQEYFFSAAAIADAIEEYTRNYGTDFSDFAAQNVFQLNDTHPVVAILELLRVLTKEYGVGFNKALEIVKHCFAYTNHTIMAEALERWDMRLLEAVLPEIAALAKTIARRADQELAKSLCEAEAKKARILDNGVINMANLAVTLSFSVNGVAKIHTSIIKNNLFDVFYKLYPGKFNNKTNGVTQRRWLALANPGLSALITEKIGKDWLTDLDELKRLEAFASPELYRALDEVKASNKRTLAAYIMKKERVALDPESLFDVQIKRLHEYKRQLMNALSILYLYYGLKDGSIKDFAPTSFLFGAKAAGSYYRAKAVIKFINEIAAKLNADPETNGLLKVVFVTDYNVSYAEKLVAAADVSEQISLAGTEASGTGNMKLALNGAVTLGTMDGATIEIVQRAEAENNYIFGITEDEVIRERGVPRETYLKDPGIKRVVDALIDGSFDDGGTGNFKNLHESLIKEGDRYLVLSDLKSYIDTKLRANRDYRKEGFAAKALKNIANSGYFSSDRAVEEYEREIWKTGGKQ